jgi:hypothetical protein
VLPAEFESAAWVVKLYNKVVSMVIKLMDFDKQIIVEIA